jgi:hypothetical protein
VARGSTGVRDLRGDRGPATARTGGTRRSRHAPAPNAARRPVRTDAGLPACAGEPEPAAAEDAHNHDDPDGEGRTHQAGPVLLDVGDNVHTARLTSADRDVDAEETAGVDR